MTFEYLVVDLTALPVRVTSQDYLNTLGSFGWELVAVTAPHAAFLKRAIPGKVSRQSGRAG